MSVKSLRIQVLGSNPLSLLCFPVSPVNAWTVQHQIKQRRTLSMYFSKSVFIPNSITPRCTISATDDVVKEHHNTKLTLWPWKWTFK